MNGAILGHGLGHGLDQWIGQYSLLLSDICQLLSLVVISWGLVQAVFVALRDALRHRQIFVAFQHSRLILGYSFSLSLSFILGSSIIKTMTTSDWKDIAQLAVVVGIRTAVNLLLERAARISAQLPLDSEMTSDSPITPDIATKSSQRFRRRSPQLSSSCTRDA